MKNLKYFIVWPFFLISYFIHEGSLKKRILATGGFLAFGVLINFLTSCSYYHAYSESFPRSADLSPDSTGYNKVFVVHNGSLVYVLNKIQIGNDSIKGEILSESYKFPYKATTFPKMNSSKRYKKSKGDQRILNEVHIYLKETNEPVSYQKSVAIKDIYRFDVYKHDGAMSVLSAMFFLIPLLFIFVLILSASCPYIYVNNGTGFELAGEIYSGAIYAPLERNDYLTLPGLVAENGKYLLKISNELEEVQNTNLAELIVIDHPSNTNVLIDKYGLFHTSKNYEQPFSATNRFGNNILDIIKAKDSLIYFGCTSLDSIYATEEVTLSFYKPSDATSVKIFIRAKNSEWLENVYKNTRDLMGSYSKKWTEKQNKSDGDKMREWMVKQKIPLLVYIEKNGQWVFCDYFNVAGPLMMKEDVLKIDLAGISDEPLRLKLQSGSFFWEIDYVGVDYSEDMPVRITTEKIEKAVTEKEELVTDLLKYDDIKYYTQNLKYSSADLTFNVPPLNEDQRTIVLHSKGYYNIKHEGKGMPHLRKLKSINEPGQFPEFSKELLNSEIESLKSR